jgi:hypothetical protein
MPGTILTGGRLKRTHVLPISIRTVRLRRSVAYSHMKKRTVTRSPRRTLASLRVHRKTVYCRCSGGFGGRRCALHLLK